MAGLWALLGLVFLDVLLSATWSALVNVRRSRLEDLPARQVRRLVAVLEDGVRWRLTIRVSRTLLRFLAPVVAVLAYGQPVMMAVQQAWPGLAGVAPTVVVLVLVVLAAMLMVGLGEMAPEGVVSQEPEAWAVRLLPLAVALQGLMTPLVQPLVWLSGVLGIPLDGYAPFEMTPEALKTLISGSDGNSGGIEAEDRKLIVSVLGFSETLAREVMIPRIDVKALEIDTPFAQALDAVLLWGYSRVPVYAGSIDNVQGLLYAKDLLKVFQAGGRTQPLADLLRPPYFVPETKRLGDLLSEMQQRRRHMAIVVDEFGGMAGVVTLEDVVEEIIGEVQDEYDSAEEFRYSVVDEDAYLVYGGIDLDDLNDLLDIELESAGADTLGGLIYEHLGRVPVPDEDFEIEGVRLQVKNVVGRRIRRVLVTRLPQPDDEDEEDDDD